MTDVRRGVEIEVLWLDDSMIELGIKAANGRYAGETTFYAAPDSPRELARHIAGFPSSASDSRAYEFGTHSPEQGARLQFMATDRLGHCALAVTLHENASQMPGDIQSVSLVVRIDPASVDAFAEQLMQMKLRVGERAFLPMAD